MPVQISHAKLGMKALWGQADRYLGKLEEARARGINVSVDVYPYTFWQTTLTILFPDRDYGDLEAARYALEQVVAPEDIRFVVYRPDPSLEGRTLAEIAMERNEPSEETLISLIVDSPTPEDFELVLMEAMSQNDVDQLLAWPHANICSDGHLADRHPRGAGAFTRVLRYHVREKGLLSLEEAIHKMTGLAAAHMGLSERGLLRAGYFADMVLFDPAIVADQSTVENPQALSSGIDRVWVNGEKVYEETKSTGLRPGRFLRHIQGT
jgi:N-acyl-D-amino-acid deacylase